MRTHITAACPYWSLFLAVVMAVVLLFSYAFFFNLHDRNLVREQQEHPEHFVDVWTMPLESVTLQSSVQMTMECSANKYRGARCANVRRFIGIKDS